MDKPNTKAAAQLLTQSDSFQAGPIAWLTFFDIISEAVRLLVEGCAPQPQDAVEFINWKPVLPRLMHWRLVAHRRRLATAFARQARTKGLSPYEVAESTNNFMKAVENGAVTIDLMRGLYAENNVG